VRFIRDNHQRTQTIPVSRHQAKLHLLQKEIKRTNLLEKKAAEALVDNWGEME